MQMSKPDFIVQKNYFLKVWTFLFGTRYAPFRKKQYEHIYYITGEVENL